MKNRLLTCLAFVMFSLSGSITTAMAGTQTGETEEFTPLIVQLTAEPHLAKLSDGTYCLNYELVISNALSSGINIESIQVIDPSKAGSIVGVLNKEEIEKEIYLPGVTTPTTALASGQSGFIRVNLSFPSLEEAPKDLEHIVTISLDKPSKNVPSLIVERLARTPVISEQVIIGPPLKGEKWIAISVGKDSYHRKAIMPVNGSWFAPERWAVDWVQLTDENKLYSGDPVKNESYPQYGKEVIAVSDGAIEVVRDGLADIPAGNLPEGMTIQDAGGNYIVQDIGNGYYAFYAHLKPGSIKVKEGQIARKGEAIALLGNSGNTTAPHLHFHVIKGKLPLGSDGVPYVIDSFVLNGRAVSADFLETELKEDRTPDVVKEDNTGKRSNEMPQNLALVDLPS